MKLVHLYVYRAVRACAVTAAALGISHPPRDERIG